MKITIETMDDELVALLTDGHFSTEIVTITGSVSIRYEGTDELTGFSTAPYAAKLVTFTVEHVDAIACGIIASWLYDKLKNRRAELSIGDEEPVMITSEAIRQALIRRKAKDNQANQ